MSIRLWDDTTFAAFLIVHDPKGLNELDSLSPVSIYQNIEFRITSVVFWDLVFGLLKLEMCGDFVEDFLLQTAFFSSEKAKKKIEYIQF